MTDNVIPLNPPPEKPKKEAKCSFCGKAESQVKHMIGNGIDKHICNDCVVKAKQRLQEAA